MGQLRIGFLDGDDSCKRAPRNAHTRAAKWAYFSTTVDDLLPLLQKILPLEQTRQLTIRRSDQTAALKQTSPAVQPAPDNKLDFL